jgi:hypothetical protein
MTRTTYLEGEKGMELNGLKIIFMEYSIHSDVWKLSGKEVKELND